MCGRFKYAECTVHCPLHFGFRGVSVENMFEGLYLVVGSASVPEVTFTTGLSVSTCQLTGHLFGQYGTMVGVPL